MEELLNPGKLLYYIYDFFRGFMDFMKTDIDLGIFSFQLWNVFLGGGIALFATIVVLIIVKRVVPLA